MTPEAYVSHQSPRRVRIKVPAKRGDETYFASLRDNFEGCEGIETVDVNPVTGSILFTHTADFKIIKEYVAAKNIFTLKMNSSPPLLNSRIKARFNTFDNQVKTVTGREVDIPGIAFLTLLGFGISQVAAGKAQAIPWHAAFWYALNVFLMKKPAR